MKAKILSLLLVVALVVTVSVFTVQAATDPCTIDYSTDTLTLDANNQDTCPVCDKTVTWQPLPVANTMGYNSDNAATGQVVATGHYYLDPSVEYSAANNTEYYGNTQASGGSKICLHLNGQTWTGSKGFFYGSWASTLNVMGSGIVQTANANDAARSTGLISFHTATVNLYGGTYQYVDGGTHKYPAIKTLGNSKLNIYKGVTIQNVDMTEGSNDGAAIYASSGTINMYGGTIQNCKANYGGASVYLKASSSATVTFTMHAGLITGGNVSTANASGNGNGGNVRIVGNSTTKKATFNLKGGTISNGTSFGTGSGGNIVVFGYGVLNMSGGTVEGGTNAGTGHGGNISVKSNGTATFSGGTVQNGTSESGSGGNMQVEGSATISGTNFIGGVSKTAAPSDLSKSMLVTGGGNIRVTVGATLDMTGGSIQGGQVTSTSNGAGGNCVCVNGVFNMSGGQITAAATGTTLHGGGTILIGGTSNGAVATMNLTGGTVTCSGASATRGQIELHGTVGGKLIMGVENPAEGYVAPVIENGTATNGGNVCLYGGGEFTMYNGTIRNGAAGSAAGSTAATSTGGGNLYMTGGTVTLKGGTISGGTSKYVGGNIFKTGGTLYLSGTEVSGGKTGEGDTLGTAGLGGNIWHNNGSAVLHINGSTVTGGQAETGGNVYLAAGTINLTSGSIAQGTASVYGGNIQVCGSTAKLSVSGGTMEGGTARYGGSISVTNGTVLLSGGTVQNGVATHTSSLSRGGNIYAVASTDSKVTLTISDDAKILNGSITASANNSHGGNLYVGSANTTATISGGKLYGGVTQAAADKSPQNCYAGNVYVAGGATLTMTDGIIANGNAKAKNSHGGNVYPAGTFNLEGGEIYGGKCTGYGGNIGMVSAGTFNMSGGILNGAAVEGVAAKDGYAGANNLLVYAGTVNLTGGEIINGNDAGGYSVQLRKGASVTSISATLGGDAKIDQLGIYSLDGTTLTIKADFCGTAHLRWYDSLKIPSDAEAGFHSTLTYGVKLSTPIVVEENYNNTGSLWTKSMPVVYGDLESDGVKELYITSYVKDVGEEVFEGVVQRKLIGVEGPESLAEGEALIVFNTKAVPVITGTTTIDTNNKSITVQVNDGAVLNLIATETDDFAGTPGKVTVQGEGTVNSYYTDPTTGYSYLTVKNADGTYSAHRLVLKMKSVALRTGTAGIYYSVEIRCNRVLGAMVQSYGVALSVQSMPDETFAQLGTSRTDVRYTSIGKCECGGTCKTPNVHFQSFVSGVYNSCALNNILTDNIPAGGITNAQRGQMPVYANGYVTLLLPDGTDLTLMTDEVNKNKNTSSDGWDASAATAYSIYDVMKLVDDGFDSLDPEDQSAIVAFYTTWASYITDWELPKIKQAYQNPQA